MKKLTIGILAHVDAGKTTLAEAMLYHAGKIRKIGRVDQRNTYLDTHIIERERGITIFAKQAVFSYGGIDFTLLDTPGHVDFSAEMERTLSILDYAVLVISGSEGVQAHTRTLWHLLAKYHVPVFLFVTKMDLAGADKTGVLVDLREGISQGIIAFDDPAHEEQIAMLDEDQLEHFMEHGSLSHAALVRQIATRKLFPCYFGSGLRMENVDRLLDALVRYTVPPEYGTDFSASVYKIAHDKTGAKLTYLKLTGGVLSVRQAIQYTPFGSDTPITEKITAIRRYSGEKFDTLDVAEAGEVCTVLGLTKTYAGMGLGAASEAEKPVIEPVLNYRLCLPREVDPQAFYPKLIELEEEEPELHLLWNERFREIHVRLMGEVQTEILSRLIADRFGIDVTFADGRILYRETIAKPVEGVGHFEPLRHYAEVHLLLEPLPNGSGLQFDSALSENELERNWQRLILTHLREKQHVGVLTGSPITDMKITLVAGRAHLKHTQGGDFRESTYRALRQGMMLSRAGGNMVLLEPYYTFRLEVPSELVGHAITDILHRESTFTQSDAPGGMTVLSGRGPVAALADYAGEVAAYTHGKGRFSCQVEGYFPCHNTDTVIADFAYDPTADLDNTPDSVFCARGAGFVVPWDHVREYMHLEGCRLPVEDAPEPVEKGAPRPIPPTRVIEKNLRLEEKELEAIMEREFGPIKRRVYAKPEQAHTPNPAIPKYKKSLFIIDGYNLIFAWEELTALAEHDLSQARDSLCDILANYQAYTGRDMIVVFDAYNVKGAVERKFDVQGLHVVYTKEDELGDTYIEKLVHTIGRDYSVRVVTSDGLIQLQAVRSGVLRLSAREFRREILAVDEEIAALLSALPK